MKQLIRNTKISTQLSLAFLLLAVTSLSFLSYHFLVSNQEIGTRSNGIVGSRYTSAIREILKSLPLHRGVTNAVLHGDQTIATKLPEIRNSVSSAFDGAVAYEKDVSEIVDTGERLVQLRNRWKALESGATAESAEEIFSRHTLLISDLIDLQKHAADQSGFILDPHQDSHHLASLIVKELPMLAELAGQARGLGGGMAASGDVSQELYNNLLEKKVALQVVIRDARYSINYAGKSNELIQKRLDKLSEQLSTDGENFINLIDQLLNNPADVASADHYINSGTALISSVNGIAEESTQLFEELVSQRIDALKNETFVSTAAVSICLLLACITVLFTVRNFTRRLRKVIAYFKGIAEGNLDQEITTSSNDEAGKLLIELAAMQKKLRESTENESVVSKENLRIRQALDTVSNATMIANSQGQIIYMNRSAHTLMSASERNIRNFLPDFSADSIIGQSMDVFHKKPSHQQDLLASLDSTYKSEVSLGEQIFSLKANRVLDDEGERIGSVVEWDDISEERAIRAEVSRIVKAASAGDLQPRLNLDKRQGFFADLAADLNTLLDGVSSVLSEAGNVIAGLAEGDLTRKINGHYEGQFETLAENINSSVDKITEVVVEISAGSDDIKSNSKSIAHGTGELASRTEEQASALEQTASSMEQISGLVEQTAENANQVNHLADSVSSAAREGAVDVEKATEAMMEIDASSKKIAAIIAIIDDIAFQTNLLALNASVEAARAGEQGRGFAVVASEVQILAKRSTQAAREIGELIEDSSRKVTDGAELVHKSGETLGQLVKSFQEVADKVDEITIATSEQSEGIKQVNLAINSMDHVTQQNVALVEETMAASEHLSSKAKKMASKVAFFKHSTTYGAMDFSVHADQREHRGAA